MLEIAFLRSNIMDNNKNRMKDRPKSNPELRKMQSKDFGDAGIDDGHKIGVHESGHEKSDKYNTQKDNR